MKNLPRTILIILAAVIVVVIAAIATLLFMVNPNQYRPTIEEAVYEATGLRLEIAGDMSLMFRPYVGMTLDDVRLRNPARPQELASSSQITLRVDAGELLAGRLLVEELQADNFHLNWYVDVEGNSLWMTERLASPQQTGNQQDSDEPAPLETRFDSISISNASVDIQDLARGYYYSVRDLHLTSQNSNLAGNPFPLQASLELIDPTAPKPWPLTLAANSRIDLEAGDIEFSGIQLGVTPAMFEGDILVQDLFDNRSWQVQLSSSEFNLDDLLDNLLGESEQAMSPSLPGVNQDRLWQFQIEAGFRGDSRGVEMPALIATLGEMRLEMDAGVRFGDGLLPTNARFSIETGGLDLSHYLATDEPPAANLSPGEPDPAEEMPQEPSILALEIPDSLRAGMNVQGSVSIGSLFVAGTQFGTINLFANLESGVLDVELQPTTVLDGSIEGNLRINSVPAESEVSLEFFTDNINVADLALPMVVPGTFGGRLSLESRFSGTGSTLEDWLEGFSGATSFAVSNSSADIGILKQVFTAIAVLSPTGEVIQQWPDAVRFSDFSGYVLFEDGLDNNQQVKMRLDNFDIAGQGGIDLSGRSFNYDLLFTVLGEPYVQTIPTSPGYHNVSWPVQCSAGFDDPVNRFCRPDLAQVRDIFSQLGSDTPRNPDEEIISQQAPEGLGGLIRGLLRNLFPDQELSDEETPDQEPAGLPDQFQ